MAQNGCWLEHSTSGASSDPGSVVLSLESRVKGVQHCCRHVDEICRSGALLRTSERPGRCSRVAFHCPRFFFRSGFPSPPGGPVAGTDAAGSSGATAPGSTGAWMLAARPCRSPRNQIQSVASGLGGSGRLTAIDCFNPGPGSGMGKTVTSTGSLSVHPILWIISRFSPVSPYCRTPLRGISGDTVNESIFGIRTMCASVNGCELASRALSITACSEHPAGSTLLSKARNS